MGRRWRPELERDRSMRAYEQNPRALTEASEPVEEEEVEYFCGSGYCDDPACTGEHWMEPAS